MSFKKQKKKDVLIVDEKKGHLFYGDQKRDLRLLMLRPIELIEFAEFAGANADDILIWCGKTIGKHFLEKIAPDENWTGINMGAKKEAFNAILEHLEGLGYGLLSSNVQKDKIFFSVEDPISADEKDNIMAKNVCLFYEGLFNGILEILDIDVESDEVQCYLLGDSACTFRMDLIIDEFDDKDVDQETGQGAISDFLSTL
jgi:predicted hydrocarbon binding protein